MGFLLLLESVEESPLIVLFERFILVQEGFDLGVRAGRFRGFLPEAFFQRLNLAQKLLFGFRRAAFQLF